MAAGAHGNLEGLRVPAGLRPVAGEIVAITDRSCAECLDAEYAALCRRLVARLARKRPSPLVRGDTRIWAAGSIYAVAQINFLFDASELPHISAAQLATHLGVVKTSMANKAARIRKLLDLGAYEPEFTRRVHARAAPAHLARPGQRTPRRCPHPPNRDPGRSASARPDPRSRHTSGGVSSDTWLAAD